ncbi:hypothetical protein CHLRE_16g665250v5 [Chlamydomonas reinhardtii]|uniref:Thylakoid membrane protein n=1 Tax=Chlamydomonas reinhardtii TaxID=3055 RepID=A8JF87_CHLRE|nr:uncharacterized protein CHLRE_16g665250v5 [Chlamydomonas reinhardtii]PNW71696.1 hypothetical protein CHLRE_16g665250v5 [Chlamydomonas reinhardtii]|eukprot:XP_001701444.1 predicted protein [Chlamydomonas reinhardtii]
MAALLARSSASTAFAGRRASGVACPRAPVSPVCIRRSVVSVRASAEPSAPAKPAGSQEYVEDSEFAVSKISFGSILTPVGLGLLFWGFGAYFLLLPGADLSSLFLIYGFPISLLGFALSYAQLKPVPCKTTKAAFALRESQMTDIQKQIREDVTRFRYGDEQHLEEALDRIFKPTRPGGVARKFLPTLIGIREEVIDNAYALVLEFSSTLDEAKWNEFQPKIQSFFGPGIVATVTKTGAGVDVALICDGSGAGRSGKDKKDVLPPLLPGLKARQQE